MFKSTTNEVLNFRKKIDALEVLVKNQHGKFEKFDYLEAQINKLNKEFANSSQIVKSFEIFTKEISNLKEKTNNLAAQVT